MMELRQQTLLWIALTRQRRKRIYPSHKIRMPTVNLGSEPLLQTQMSSTPSVNALANNRKNTPETPVKVFRSKKIHQKQSLKTPPVTTPDPDLQIIEVREETRSQSLKIFSIAVSLLSSLKEELIKDDFIYVPSESQTQETSVNDSPSKSQQQPCKEALVGQSEQEACVDVYPSKPKKQAGKKSSPTRTKPEPLLNVSPLEEQQQPCQEAPLAWQLEEEAQPDFAASPSLWEHDAPSFDLGINAGVAAALKFADATSAEPNFTAAEVYKTPEKEKEITEELKEKCYHWMTHMKETKDSTNEYDPIFVLKHEAKFEGLRHHFMSLMPEKHVESMRFILQMFMLETHGEKYIDPKTNKDYRMDVDRYAHYRQFLDKRKLASHPFLFVPICNGGHWWLWITDVRKKIFYMLDPVNKKKNEISDLRIKLNKFVNMNKVQFIVVANFHSLFISLSGINNLPDEGLRWDGTLNGGRRGRRSRVYQAEWSTYKLETIDPRKIKKGKRYQYKAWKQEEIDAFRLEYAPKIMLHKLNKIRDQVIRASEAIRLSMPSAALFSPYCSQ
ncbi:uncharacterized protein DS421_11g326040 [Arachis hypogaea]|nr:uncharacterized protein DS421_11g326040 [Arachis hypogaea]